RSMSSIRRSALQERSSTSRKNCGPVMMVARQASCWTRRGHRSLPNLVAQSSQPGGIRWVCRSIAVTCPEPPTRTTPPRWGRRAGLSCGSHYAGGGPRVNCHGRGVSFPLTVLVDGALTGALYAPIALAFVVVYRASGVINFALGEWTMLGAAFATTGLG